MEAKIYENMSEENYNNLDGARSTILSTISKRTLAHAFHQMNNYESKDYFKIGQATHDYILRPSEFIKKWGILSPEYKGTTTVGKEEKARLSGFFGENILKYDEYQEIIAYKMSLENNVMTKLILDNLTNTELSLQWEERGITCKARIDGVSKLPNGMIILIDLKTTKDASLDSFQKSIINFNYHIQTAHYLSGAKACGLIEEQNNYFIHICIEKEAPFLTATYMLDDGAISMGNTLRLGALSQYSEALKTGKWTGYKERIQDIALPNWYINKEDLILDEVA